MSFFFNFYFIFKLYIIVLILPNIKVNPPQVYMCSPSWTLLPPPSPYHPSGSSHVSFLIMIFSEYMPKSEIGYVCEKNSCSQRVWLLYLPTLTLLYLCLPKRSESHWFSQVIKWEALTYKFNICSSSFFLFLMSPISWYLRES